MLEQLLACGCDTIDTRLYNILLRQFILVEISHIHQLNLDVVFSNLQQLSTVTSALNRMQTSSVNIDSVRSQRLGYSLQRSYVYSPTYGSRYTPQYIAYCQR